MPLAPCRASTPIGAGWQGEGGHIVTACYWDSTTSGITGGRTAAQLQAPTGYIGIYQSWNIDVDGDRRADDPWDFGTTSQYPALSVDFDGDGQATWQEFGHQLRAGPALAVEAGQNQVVLTWTEVDATHWTPPPGITYNIHRYKDTTVETPAVGLDALEYTDSDVTDGPFIYQVAAVVDGGQATHGARIAASNTAPVAAPDLVVGTPTVSDDSPLAGASFTLRATVRNEGSGAADSTTMRYYRSTDTTIDTNDSSVRTATVSSLSAGASSAQSTSVTAPSTAGTYYYGGCVDAVANESNTTNNCSLLVEVTVLRANAAPSFTSSATISVAENQTSAGTVQATDSDVGDDITGYAITGGADQSFFSIVATSGALTFKTAPNYEDAQDQGAGNSYVVVVRATSGTGTRVKTATQTITVTVTDVDTEAPGKPGTPRVTAASASRLNVIWSAPDNAGPPIRRYEVQYRTSSPEGSWTEVTVPSIAARIENLSENTSYQVQVRATNAEGTGPWSDSGSGTTDANAAPSFSSPSTFSVAENRTRVGTVLATDSDAGDNITGYAITGGADQSFFSIGATSGR